MRALIVVAVVSLLAGCGGTVRKPFRPLSTTQTMGELVGRIVAAGDIACAPSDPSFDGGHGTRNRCHMQATADVLLSVHPIAVLTMGDNQYERGRLSDFLQSYDRSWGRLKAVTHPTAGNHEYWTANAAGYFEYFGTAAGTLGKGYYSFDLGGWHLIALNSNCRHVGGCGLGSPQELWLRDDLRRHRGGCTLAYWHHPRFSSGIHGSNRAYVAFWRDLYEAGADIVLAGHDHHYERFAAQDPEGNPDTTRGLREFVVGTGGKGGFQGFYRFLPVGGYRNPNSEVRNSDTFGVLLLTLYSKGYEWSFAPETGKTFTDFGFAMCHVISP
jgi:hypothetical protein